MPTPNILPSTIPKGTKFTSNSHDFEFISIGIKGQLPSVFGTITVYSGDVINLTTNVIITNHLAYVHAIDWDGIVSEINNENINTPEPVKIEKKLCLWCGETLGSNQNSPYCEVGKVYCKEYYFALKERMELDFRDPSEALEYDKASVKRWVNNLLRIK